MQWKPRHLGSFLEFHPIHPIQRMRHVYGKTKEKKKKVAKESLRKTEGTTEIQKHLG